MTADSRVPRASSSRLKSVAVFLLKATLAALLVWWLWKSGRLNFSQLAKVKIGTSLFALLFFQAAMLACIALRWHFLTRAGGLDFSLRQTLRISLIGNFAAVWTPAGLGLDGARLWQSRRLAPGQMSRIIASTFWDRALGAWAILVLTALSCAFLLCAQGTIDAEPRRALWGVLVLCLALSVAPLIARRAVFRVLQRRWPEAVAASLFQSAGWKNALLFAFLTHGANALALWCALRVLDGDHARLLSVLLVAPPVILSSLVPLTPLGLGVTDAAASTLFLLIGSRNGAEATMLARVTFVAMSALCGLAWLKGGAERPTSRADG